MEKLIPDDKFEEVAPLIIKANESLMLEMVQLGLLNQRIQDKGLDTKTVLALGTLIVKLYTNMEIFKEMLAYVLIGTMEREILNDSVKSEFENLKSDIRH